MYECRISTIDNPKDPFDQYEEWLYYDHEVLGYYSDQYVARLALTSDALSDVENANEYERAIDRIIQIDPFNIYIKVKRQI